MQRFDNRNILPCLFDHFDQHLGKEKDFAWTEKSTIQALICFCAVLSRTGLTPMKLAYDARQPDNRLR